MIGARGIGGQEKVLIPGGVEAGPDDTAELPNYMKPYINEESHPIRRGTFSPDLVDDTKALQQSNITMDSPFVGKDADPKFGGPITDATIKQGDSAEVPIDPLTGNPVGWTPPAKIKDAERNDILRIVHLQYAALQALVTEIRGQTPQVRCKIQGDAQLTPNAPSLYKFEIGDKKVPALSLLVQNNSGATLFIDLDGQAGPGTIQILAGGTFNGVTKVNSLNMYSTTNPTVNGALSTGVVIRAWSNPEYQGVRGNA